MYNPNMPNINGVGHYKKINVTELMQMQEEELIKFFVDVSDGELEEIMGIMTEDEREEMNYFIDNMPKDVFNEIIKRVDKKNNDLQQQLIQQCNNTLYKINNAINLGRQALEEATTLMHDINSFIDEHK